VHNDLVELAKAGDRCTFTGCLIVIPDVAQLTFSGGKVESTAEGNRKGGVMGDGITGLRTLGVRELNYKLAFMACMVQPSGSRVRAI
jgi:DNA replication licensing factor MCM6